MPKERSGFWAGDAFGWFLTGCGADTMQVQRNFGGSLAGFGGKGHPAKAADLWWIQNGMQFEYD
jgi:hypothetical protein